MSTPETPSQCLARVLAKYYRDANEIVAKTKQFQMRNPDRVSNDVGIDEKRMEALRKLREVLRITRNVPVQSVEEGNQLWARADDDAKAAIDFFRALEDDEAWELVGDAAMKVNMQKFRKTEPEQMLWLCTFIQIARHWGFGTVDLDSRVFNNRGLRDAEMWNGAYEFLARADLYEQGAVLKLA